MDIYIHSVLTLILIAAMLFEARQGRIPNLLTLQPFVLFILVMLTAPDPGVLTGRLVQGAVVLVAGLVLFALAGRGAGAVKLASGVALFIPPGDALLSLGLLVALVWVGSFVVLRLRKMKSAPTSAWTVLAKGTLPLSWPIGIAALVAIWG